MSDVKDVMRRLAEARPEHLDPRAPIDPTTRSAELTRSMAATPSSGSSTGAVVRRRSRRPVWGLGMVGVLAAAAVAVASVGTGDTGAPVMPTDSSPPPARAQGEITIDARTALLAAAHGAQRQPAAAGRYWHSRIQYGTLEQVGPADNRYAVLHRYQQDMWAPRSADEEGWFRSEDFGARPATPADEAAWRADGSPTSWSSGPQPGADGSSAPGRDLLMHPKDSAFAHPTGKRSAAPDDLNITQDELDRTPADPARLRALLLGHPLGEADDGENTDIELFRTAAGILLTKPLPPDKRAAFYRMLADIDGVTATDGVKDATGRPGTALKMRGNGPDGLTEIHFIVDRTTGAGLSTEIRYLRGKGAKSWLKPGDRAYYEVVTSQWVDTLPPMPRPPGG